MTWLRKVTVAIRGDSSDNGSCHFDSGDIPKPSNTNDSKQGLALPPSYLPHDPKMLGTKPIPSRQPFLFSLLDEKYDDIQVSSSTRAPNLVLQRITRHLNWVDQTCFARTSKSIYNVLQIQRWDPSGIPQTQAEYSLVRCLCQRDDPAHPSCVDCHDIFARAVDGIDITYATAANGWSFLLTADVLGFGMKGFQHKVFKHLLPQCVASPTGSIKLTRGHRNWVHSNRVEVDVRLVQVDRKAVAVTR